MDKAGKLERLENFAIIMYEKVGYAIPIPYVMEVIQVPTKEVADTIRVAGEVIPVFSFKERVVAKRYMDHQTFCILCKKKDGNKVAFVIGDMLDSCGVFVRAIPAWNGDAPRFLGKESLGTAVSILYGKNFDGYQLNRIEFEEPVM